MRLHPCNQYPESRVRELWGGRESLTPLEILDLPIPAADRVWVMCQPGVLPKEMREAAVSRIVTRAVRNYALPHPATSAWAEKWLSGGDRTIEAAAEAARAAAEAAERAAWAARAAAQALAARAREEDMQVDDFRAAVREAAARA